MKKLIISKNAIFIVFASSIFLSGCADWRSKPVVVDNNWGNSVSNMVEAQTLNPNAAYADKPVVGLDGQKSEGNIKAYRSGSSDLRKGKKTVTFDVDGK